MMTLEVIEAHLQVDRANDLLHQVEEVDIVEVQETMGLQEIMDLRETMDLQGHLEKMGKIKIINTHKRSKLSKKNIFIIHVFILYQTITNHTG